MSNHYKEYRIIRLKFQMADDMSSKLNKLLEKLDEAPSSGDDASHFEVVSSSHDGNEMVIIAAREIYND